jgi:large subunit ribosomal protein L31
MKPNLHPEYKDVKVTCSCGSSFVTRSTLGKESLSLEVCAKCHPFYTGTQKIMDTAGRVDRFRQKYGMKDKDKQTDDTQK